MFSYFSAAVERKLFVFECAYYSLNNVSSSHKRFVKGEQWPPKSPDCNVLDYYFWNKLKEEVYKGRREPFENLEQLKRRIKLVWNRSINVDELRKAILQFRPRLQAVVNIEGGPIKHMFK